MSRAHRWSKRQLADRLSDGHVAVAGIIGAEADVADLKDPAPAARRSQLQLGDRHNDTAAELLLQIRLAGLPFPELEYHFHDVRRWRADFAWPDRMLLAEYEGGTAEWARGRHVRGEGFDNDCEKYNEAQLLGFRVLRFTWSTVRKGIALQWIERALEAST